MRDFRYPSRQNCHPNEQESDSIPSQSLTGYFRARTGRVNRLSLIVNTISNDNLEHSKGAGCELPPGRHANHRLLLHIEPEEKLNSCVSHKGAQLRRPSLCSAPYLLKALRSNSSSSTGEPGCLINFSQSARATLNSLGTSCSRLEGLGFPPEMPGKTRRRGALQALLDVLPQDVSSELAGGSPPFVSNYCSLIFSLLEIGCGLTSGRGSGRD
jgi:hypothetical protein